METKSITEKGESQKRTGLSALLGILLILTIAGGIATLVLLRQVEELKNGTSYVNGVSSCTRTAQNDDRHLLIAIDFSYPCGWHVAEHAGASGIHASTVELNTDIIYLGPWPIAIEPNDREPGTITVALDHVLITRGEGEEKRRSLNGYIEETKKGFVDATVSTFTNAQEVSLTKIEGTMQEFGHEFPGVVYLATAPVSERQGGGTRILHIIARNPDTETKKALALLIDTVHILAE